MLPFVRRSCSGGGAPAAADTVRDQEPNGSCQNSHAIDEEATELVEATPPAVSAGAGGNSSLGVKELELKTTFGCAACEHSL